MTHNLCSEGFNVEQGPEGAWRAELRGPDGTRLTLGCFVSQAHAETYADRSALILSDIAASLARARRRRRV